jgi:hypothetical protein
VLGDCGATDIHPFGDLPDRSCAAAQALQHRPPGWISQGIEGPLCVSNHLRKLPLTEMAVKFGI